MSTGRPVSHPVVGFIALIFLAFRFTSWDPDQVRPVPAAEPRGG